MQSFDVSSVSARQIVEQIAKLQVIWHTMTFMWYLCNPLTTIVVSEITLKNMGKSILKWLYNHITTKPYAYYISYAIMDNCMIVPL